MAGLGVNVGPADARARQIAGALAILGGLSALDPFFQALGFLTWIICAAMIYVALILIIGGFTEGTGVFGVILALLALLDGWLPLSHRGAWGLLLGVMFAAWTFLTARSRRCPINTLMGVNTAGK